jgi:hypothetical protein
LFLIMIIFRGIMSKEIVITYERSITLSLQYSNSSCGTFHNIVIINGMHIYLFDCKINLEYIKIKYS